VKLRMVRVCGVVIAPNIVGCYRSGFPGRGKAISHRS
jgi:hypothetical protein